MNKYVLTIICVLWVFAVCGQNKVLFILELPPDARASGMGDVGLATKPDAVSQRWNAAKLIFAEKDAGMSLSYVPWLSKLTKGMNLTYLSGYYRPGERSVIGASFTYFSIGDITLSSSNAQILGVISTQEYALDLSYSHKLTDHLSGGIVFRYASALNIKNTGSGSDVIGSAPAFAGDINFFYTTPMQVSKLGSDLSFGLRLSNLGTKVKTSDTYEKYLPMSLGIGTTWDLHINSSNSLATSFDINKSLVPKSFEPDLGIIQTATKSFGSGSDIGYSMGLEYAYRKTLMLRGGYRANEQNSLYKYITVGAGVNYSSLTFDISYLISQSKVSNALSNTLKFTIGYTFSNNSKQQTENN